jgi:thioesterase domain-containing protein
MPSIDLIKVLDLLTRTNDHGLHINYSNGELSVKFRKGAPVDPGMLHELRSNKDHLIEYFRYYRKEFSEEDDPGSSGRASAADGQGVRRTPGSHLVLLSPGSEVSPLFIVPGTGGKSGGYQMLGDCFRDEYPIYGLEMMGTQKGETPLRSIQEIAAQNIRWIRQIYPKGPYRLIGHSFGAYVMYEMTRQLEAGGESPDFIAVLDQPIRRLSGLALLASKSEFVMRMTRDYFESFKIIAAPYPQWTAELKARLEKLPIEEMAPFIASFVSLRLPHASRVIEYVTRLVNIRVFNDIITYNPTGRIKSEVLVFKAADVEREYPEATLHWSDHAGRVRLFSVPGDHHNMLEPENVPAIAMILKQRMQY